MVQYTDRLKYLRISNNLSQKDVANLLGCSQVAYGMYELGKRRISLDKLIILAKYYNTTLDYIAGLSDQRKDDCVATLPYGDVAFFCFCCFYNRKE